MVKSESHIPKVRFQGFSDKWQKFRIIDIADYVDYRGKTPTKTSEGILLVTAKNIRQGFIDYSVSQEFISENEFDVVMSRGKVQLGDVVITTEAPLGNVASIDRVDIALAQRVIKYRGRKNILNNQFLKYRFLTSSFQKLLETKATGGTVQGIKGSTLHKLFISISHDVTEQTQIGNFFQKIDQVIELQQKALDTARDYKKSMLQKMFPQKGEKVPQIRFDGFSGDWEMDFIEKILQINSGKDYKHLSEGDIPVYGTGGYMLSVNEALSEIDAIGLGRKGSINNPQFLNAPFWTVDTLFFLTPKKEVAINFSFYLVSQINWMQYDESTGVPSLSKKTIEKVKVMFPKLDEQQKIGMFFQKLDQQIEQHEKKLQSYQNLKKAMLQRLFV